MSVTKKKNQRSSFVLPVAKLVPGSGQGTRLALPSAGIERHGRHHRAHDAEQASARGRR